VFADYAFTRVYSCNQRAERWRAMETRERYRNYLLGLETLRAVEKGVRDLDGDGRVDYVEKRVFERYGRHLHRPDQ